MSNEKQEKKYTIYCHTNKINGKKYVGITCQTTKRRWGTNGAGYKGCTAFWNAIQKHGWDNFEHEILHEELSKEKAEELEIKYIAEWGLTDSSRGYNLREGGSTNRPSEETCKKMSRSALMRYEEHPELREKCSERLKKYHEEHPELREINSKRSKEYYEEHPELRDHLRDKAVQRYKDNPELRENIRNKTKQRYEDNPELKIKFQEQMKQYRIDHPEFGKALSERNRQAFLDNPDLRRITGERLREAWRNSDKYKPIKCIETGVIYEGVTDAERAMGIDSSNVRRAVTGTSDTAGGYRFEYVDEKLRKEAEEVRKARHERNKIKNNFGVKRPIKCIETGVVYESISEAARVLDISASSICAVLSGRHKVAKGFHFQYI